MQDPKLRQYSRINRSVLKGNSSPSKSRTWWTTNANIPVCRLLQCLLHNSRILWAHRLLGTDLCWTQSGGMFYHKHHLLLSPTSSVWQPCQWDVTLKAVIRLRVYFTTISFMSSCKKSCQKTTQFANSTKIYFNPSVGNRLVITYMYAHLSQVDCIV